MRAVVDYYVDRPDVEALRGVQLTGTNRSIGLIIVDLGVHAWRQRRRDAHTLLWT